MGIGTRIAAGLIVVSSLTGGAPMPGAAAYDPGNIEGAWRLSGRLESEGGEWSTLEIHVADRRPTLVRIDAPLMAGINPTRGLVECDGDALVIVITNGYSDLTFKARLPGDRKPDRIEGPLRLRSQLFPSSPTWRARLERIPVYRKVDIKKNDETVKSEPGLGGSLAVLAAMRKAVAEIADPRYAPLDLKIARALLQDMSIDADTEERVWAESRLIDAALRAGKADIAREAEARRTPLSRLLAEEKKGQSGPLRPAPYPGRADPRHDRVVLLELFTGAECGPCVAADLGFDALIESYRPSELIALEYHLHIPRPDPLTAPDGVARAAYYDVLSTPSTLFNGKRRRRPRRNGPGRPEEVQPVPIRDRRHAQEYEGCLDQARGAEGRRAGPDHGRG